MTRLVATPVERLGVVLIEAPSVTGRLLRVRVERWSTDLLDCEAWCVLDDLRRPEWREWFRTPGAACLAAANRFCVAGYGDRPVPASVMLRGPIAPRGSLIADELVRVGT